MQLLRNTKESYKTILDANAVLRYVLNDHPFMAQTVSELIQSRPVLIKFEVLAEVFYVLTKPYGLPRLEVLHAVLEFSKIENVHMEDFAVFDCACDLYAHSSLDFVDCLLYGYRKILGAEIFTFDKKLIKKLNQLP